MQKKFNHRRVAIEALTSVLHNRKSIDSALIESGINFLTDERDSFKARQLLAGTLKHLGQIESIISQYSEKPLRKKEKVAQSIINTAVCDYVFMKSPAHAVVNEYVEIARHGARFQSGYINHVLRRISEAADIHYDKNATSRYCTWFRNKLIEDYNIKTAQNIMHAFRGGAYIDITVKNNPENAAQALGGVVIAGNTVRLAKASGLTGMDGYDSGEWWVQDFAASLPANLLVGSGTVIDLCAAPGGKTAQLAQKFEKVIAVEQSAIRAERLQSNIIRMNLANVRVEIADAAVWKPDDKVSSILLDAPCTSSGIVRKKPDMPFIKSVDDILKMQTVQLALISNALEMLCSGGVMIYSTCSVFKAEGEDVINHILQRGDVEIVPVTAEEVYGHTEFITLDGCLRILPDMLADSGGVDGFFAARVRKI